MELTIPPMERRHPFGNGVITMVCRIRLANDAPCLDLPTMKPTPVDDVSCQEKAQPGLGTLSAVGEPAGST